MNIPKGWTKHDNGLYMEVKCSDFIHALKLLNFIGDIAEQRNHHPDLGIKNYNVVYVSSTTHDTNSVTEKDYQLALAINDLLKQ